jgi:hypothetical protein
MRAYDFYFLKTKRIPANVTFLFYVKKHRNNNLFKFYQFFKIYVISNAIVNKFFIYKKYFENLIHLFYFNHKTQQKFIYLFDYFKFANNFILFNFFFVYNYFFYKNFIDSFYFYKFFQNEIKKTYYNLIFSFKSKKIFVNILNYKKKNFLFLSSGLFIKFYENRKAFKKNKTIKILIAKYLRKFFLLLKIKNAVLFIKKKPLFFLEMLNFFHQSIPYKFFDPIEEKVIEEKENKKPLTNFFYLIFLQNNTYVKNKTKKKGRIKRKILRKIVLENQIID